MNAGQKKGELVGEFSAELLPRILGERLEIRRSATAMRYPLYLVTEIGPLFLNTRGAQDFLLEQGEFFGGDRVEKVPETVEVKPLTNEQIEAQNKARQDLYNRHAGTIAGEAGVQGRDAGKSGKRGFFEIDL